SSAVATRFVVSPTSGDLARSIRAKSVYSRTILIVAAVADRGCRSQRLRLQIAAVEKNCSGAFHFIKRMIQVTRLKADSAAPVYDHVCVEVELARIECTIFHTVIQSEPEQINILNRALA